MVASLTTMRSFRGYLQRAEAFQTVALHARSVSLFLDSPLGHLLQHLALVRRLMLSLSIGLFRVALGRMPNAVDHLETAPKRLFQKPAEQPDFHTIERSPVLDRHEYQRRIAPCCLAGEGLADAKVFEELLGFLRQELLGFFFFCLLKFSRSNTTTIRGLMLMLNLSLLIL
jgi:hypothetical protein